MRRVGKSYFLKQIIDHLKQKGVAAKRIVYIDKERLEFDFIKNYEDLHEYIEKKYSGAPATGKKYLLVDEIQEIEAWERTINSLLNRGDVDIYVTGSNAHLLSSELATLISGRYVEFPIYALSFKEFLQFRGKSPGDKEVEFKNYLRFGGFPAIHHFDLLEDVVYQYIRSIYDTILLKDIIKRHNIRNVHLLENIVRYIFDNLGNIFSAKKISDYLKSQRQRIGVDTVQNYIGYFLATFAAHKVHRYDIKGKRILEIHEKYFVNDIGMRHALLSYKESELPGMLENLVYLELRRRGYNVYIGKLGEKEIDFIAEKNGTRLYIQVTYLLASDDVIEREFSPLRMVKDYYPRYVLSLDPLMESDYEGIKRIHIADFLLADEI